MTIWREGKGEIGDCDKKWGEICSLIRETTDELSRARKGGRGRRRNRLILKQEYECSLIQSLYIVGSL